jgi:hypothetical protein
MFQERTSVLLHCKRWRAGKLCVAMDIIASLLAYLGCVTGIVGALAISFFVAFSPPRLEVPAHHAMVTATSRPPVVSTVAAAAAEAKPTSAAVQRDEKLAQHETAPRPAPDIRQKARMPRAEARRLVQEERARRWAYQQDSNFDSRFLGYAD